MTPVVLGLGSNKKFSCLYPEEILGGAIFELSKIFHNIVHSSVYRTKAMYVVDQEDFYNMALIGLLDDGICARALLEKIHEIEAAFGRAREKEIRFGPRSLDIDIEFFGRQKILEPDLQIPHPRLKERAFVLTPLLEVLDSLESKEAAQNAQSGDAQAARAAVKITSTHAKTRSVNAQAARAAVKITSTHATAWNAD
ncbi:MAG: 2-amino-4-hydroxy-6-hydroxymethyldihydropteridine diphosphokinase, partial [Treponemataceae bacterium]|nr:2-amino-4-hydroxy-6-hydroxymethyldihydropteridine diphosphokinase [Treponemataceae bacterium]